MEISVKKGIRPAQTDTLSFAEEKAAEQRIRDLEAELSRTEVQQGLSYEPKDIQGIEKRLAHYKALKTGKGAKRFEGQERVQAEVEIRRIEQALARKWGGRVPTYQEYWQNQRAGISYLKLVNKIVELNRDREYAELVRRWKVLRRGMEPDDPVADNVLHLFKS
jgi:hypothetical protein